jgi:hypothetical protein
MVAGAWQEVLLKCDDPEGAESGEADPKLRSAPAPRGRRQAASGSGSPPPVQLSLDGA